MCCNPKAPGRKGTGTSQPKAQTSRPVRHHLKLGRRRGQHMRLVPWPVHAPVVTYICVIHTKISERNRRMLSIYSYALQSLCFKSNCWTRSTLLYFSIFTFKFRGKQKTVQSHGYYLFSPRPTWHTQVTISLFHVQRQKSSLKTEKTASCTTSSGKDAKRYALLCNCLLYISTRTLSQHV